MKATPFGRLRPAPSERQGRQSKLLAWVAVIAATTCALGASGQGLGLAAQSSAAACRHGTVQPRNPGSRDVLYGVAVTSGCQAWAVGQYVKGGLPRTLIEHWNGRVWRVQKSPSPGRFGSGLNGVAATSPRNVWAVGYYDAGRHAHPRRTLILHWNGKVWRAQKSPTPGTLLGDYSNRGLAGVTAISRTQAWAVGVASYRGIGDQPLIERWNGRAWRVQKSPRFPPVQDCCYPKGLNDVGSTSSTNAWAVGFIDNGGGYGPEGLIEHWNGKVWKAKTTGDFSTVSGVSPTSRTNALAVGTHAIDYCGSSGCTSASSDVIGRWSGKAWRIQTGLGPGRFNSLRDVAQTSSANAWAVGSYCQGTNRGCTSRYRPLIEHWDGMAWKIQESPTSADSSKSAYLYSIAAATRANAWAVGSDGPRALALHWNGSSWKR